MRCDEYVLCMLYIWCGNNYVHKICGNENSHAALPGITKPPGIFASPNHLEIAIKTPMEYAFVRACAYKKCIYCLQ